MIMEKGMIMEKVDTERINAFIEKNISQYILRI